MGAERLAAAATLEERPLVLVQVTARPPDGPALAETAALATARDHVARGFPGLRVTSMVGAGEPVAELLELSAEAHMVVVGSGDHAHRAGPRAAGAKLAPRAACPVVVVPGHRHPAPGLGVLVATDLTGTPGPEIWQALRQASLRRLPLTIVHARRWSTPAGRARALEHASGALTEALDAYPDVGVHLAVLSSRRTIRLARVSAYMDLVVVGGHRPARTRRGSASSRLLERAECPVLTTP